MLLDDDNSMKFRAQTPGSWTNRIIHIRYLDVSAPWALFNAHEDTVSRAARESESDNSGDDQAPPRMAKLEVEELYTNNVKVRGRIIKVVEAAPNMAIYHSYIARAIVRSFALVSQIPLLTICS
jgi:hypothetical protein